MIIAQPDRILLRKEVGSLAKELRGDILDVGGGNGNRYRHLFPQATSFRCLDINPEAHPDIVGSAESIPLPDRSVDGVLSTQMLEHVPHPWKVLAEMHRVLRPDGKVILTAPQLNEVHEEPNDYYRYTEFGLRVLCEEAGFEVLRIIQRGKYHGVMAQNRIRKWIDTWHPYERRWVMLILSPLSALYAKTAMWLDNRDDSDACRRHVIGWTLLLRKP